MKTLIRLFNKVFIIAPVLIALVLALVYVFGGWGFAFPGYDPEHFYLPVMQWGSILAAVVIVAAILLLIYILIYKSDKSAFQNFGLTVAIVFIAATLLRVLLITSYKDNLIPFSDFERIWNITHNQLSGNIEYYTLFPSYLNYSVFQRRIIELFGDSYASILYTNAILGGVVAAETEVIAYKVFHNEKPAFIAGLLYALMPSSVLYTVVGGPDLLTICLNSLGLICFIYSIEKGWALRCIGSLAAGSLLGLGASYKAFAIIIIIALIMTYGAQCLCSNGSNASADRRGIRSFVIVCICFALVFIGYELAQAAVIDQTEKEFDLQLDMGTSTPHFLLVGLNTQGEGQISEGNLSREYYQFYLNNGQNYQQAKDHAYELLKDDLRTNTKDIPLLLIRKIVWAWQDDVRPALYLDSCIDDQGKADKAELYNLINKTAPELSQVSYLLLLILALFGSSAYAKKKEISFDIELIELIIFGYFCLLLLSEAQSRYKCLIMPYICIISAMGFIEIAAISREREERVHG